MRSDDPLSGCVLRTVRDGYLQQARICLGVARMKVNPVHRATFLRLAWHWRMLARSADLVMAPVDRD